MILQPIRSSGLLNSKDDHEPDESYLASASDVMISLLFVFLITLVALALQRAADQAEARERGTARAIFAIGSAMQAAGVPIEIDAANAVLRLPADTLFERNAHRLSAQGRRHIADTREPLARALACYIASAKKEGSNCEQASQGAEIETIFIEGHTDSLPLRVIIGNEREYNNWHLGLDRARDVFDALMTSPSLREFRNRRGQPVFGVSSYADSRPAPPTGATQREIIDRRNRRVELRFVVNVDLDKLPTGKLTAEAGIETGPR